MQLRASSAQVAKSVAHVRSSSHRSQRCCAQVWDLRKTRVALEVQPFDGANTTCAAFDRSGKYLVRWQLPLTTERVSVCCCGTRLPLTVLVFVLSLLSCRVCAAL